MTLRRMRAKLFFNPSAGATRAARIEILDVIREMQAWKLVPEVSLVEDGWDPPRIISDALADGIRMFVVCGGDGTVSTVAAALAGIPSNRATLGIIPSGTQNNTALSLDVPSDIPAAIALLRTGRRVKIDIGMATCSGSLANGDTITTPFLEICSVGLISSLFPSADDVQHGNLTAVADFLATLVKSPPAEIAILLDNNKEIHDHGHVVLVSNLPFIGRNYRMSADSSYNDGLFDVAFFADLTKLELLNYVFQGVGVDAPEDPRIQHYKVRRIDIDTQPPMPIMVDGRALGEGHVQIQLRRSVLKALAGKPAQPAPSNISTAQNDAATG